MAAGAQLGMLLASAAGIGLSASAATAAGPSVHIGSAVLGQTNERFASFNVDGSWNRGFFHVDWTNPNLRAAAASLA